LAQLRGDKLLVVIRIGILIQDMIARLGKMFVSRIAQKVTVGFG